MKLFISTLFYINLIMNSCTLVDKIQEFLQQKSIKNKAKRKDFLQGTGIHKSTVSKIINAKQPNPELKNIIKIANYFNCSIDESLGRNNYIPLQTQQPNNI